MATTALLLADGKQTVYGAGDNSNGRLGLGFAEQVAQRRFTAPVQFIVGVDGSQPQAFTHTVLDSCSGWDFTCIIAAPSATSTDKKVYCSGSHAMGQLGVGTWVSGTFAYYSPVLAADRDTSNRRTDTAFMNGVSAQRVFCGGQHAAMLTSTGQVYMWGANDKGQIGQGSVQVSRLAVQVAPSEAGGEAFAHVALGYQFSILVTASGTVFVMGDNSAAQLGSPSLPSTVTTPTRVFLRSGSTDIGPSIRQLSAGGYHVVAIVSATADTTQFFAFSWGEGTNGQTGQPQPSGTAGQRWYITTPTAIAGLAGVALQTVSAGFKHTVALDNCGTVWVFGHNAFGELGDGGGTAANNFRALLPQTIPRAVQWQLNVLNVCAGAFTTFLIAAFQQ